MSRGSRFPSWGNTPRLVVAAAGGAARNRGGREPVNAEQELGPPPIGDADKAKSRVDVISTRLVPDSDE